MEKLVETGQTMGLEGRDLLNFVTEQQNIQIKEAKAKREAEAEQWKIQIEEAKAKREAEEEQQKIQIEEAKAKRQADEEQAQRKFELQQQQMKYEHEQEMEKIRRNPQNKQAEDAYVNVPVPELPMFNDERDNIDAFLRRFERVAKAMNWDTRNYGIKLGTLLGGKALNVYARLPNSEADDYSKIKNVLLKNYNLTEEGFLGKFRKSKPKDDESPEQYITRIGNYCGGWFESAGVSTYEEIKSLIVKEQFLNMCPRNLTTHLKERSFESIPEMCKQAHKQKWLTIKER